MLVPEMTRLVKEMNRPRPISSVRDPLSAREVVASDSMSEFDLQDLLRQKKAADERDRLADIREAAADERERRADAYESSLDERAVSLSRRTAGSGSSARDAIDSGRAAIARTRARIDRAQARLERSAERMNSDALSARRQQALIDAEKLISAQLLEKSAASGALPQDSLDSAD